MVRSRLLDLHNSKIYSLSEECTEEIIKGKEQYWMDNTECVNIKIQSFDRKGICKE